MRMRWFQFRLRTLLAAVVLLCIALGGWRLYWTFCGPYVKSGPAQVGAKFKVRGRFVDFLGPDSTVYAVKVSRPMSNGRPVIYQSGSGHASRSGFWTYEFELELGPVLKAGDYKLEVFPLTQAVVAAHEKARAAGVAPGPRPDVIEGRIAIIAPKED